MPKDSIKVDADTIVQLFTTALFCSDRLRNFQTLGGKCMSANKAAIAIDEPLTASNPLDFIPNEIPFDVSYGATDITRSSSGGHSGRRGRGEEAELEDERSGSRFRR
jgi:hypothetical protein